MKFALRTAPMTLAWLAVGALAAAQTSPISHDVMLKNLPARELGPTTMGGRVSHIDVFEKNPSIFFVATASGGLWKTTNAGLTSEPIFQYESTVALGTVAVNQNNVDDIWVGTGEQNSRNSTSWGDGVYRTTDGGKTWKHVGLKGSRHISRIILSKTDPNVAYVAALGPLWGAGGERGLFKTTDGGETWTRILAGTDRAGVIDVAVDPTNANVMYAALWERDRKAYQFKSGGRFSKIVKTTDGGKTWTHLTNGLPEGPIGRVGLDVSQSKPNVVMAMVEAEFGGGVYRSEDAGRTWKHVNLQNQRPFYFSIVRIDPSDDKRVYFAGVSMLYSDDGGYTIRELDTSVHVDHHAIWVNPKDPNHVMIGEDGGVGITHDKGKTWRHMNSMRIGQFYGIAADMRKPYYVYGGLQDNGSWGGPSETSRGGPSFFDWYRLSGGDGFHVQADYEDWRWVYSESQGGFMVRTNQATGESRGIRPPAASGEKQRWNWSTPIQLSPYNPAVIYAASNRVYRSVNRGENWLAISPDLTTNNPRKIAVPGGVSPEDTGAEMHCTIITVKESPKKPGVIWAGTDDGLVHVTIDDGKSWTEVGKNIPGLPPYTWCSRVEPSEHVDGRAYVTFDGHRNNDFKPYVYVTEDYGKTWKRLAETLGENNSCYVIKEGIANQNFLILGTEVGLYFSLDRGTTWVKFHKDNKFPTVRVDDVFLHSRDQDLLVGTHGRSIWQIPIGPLEQMTEKTLESDVQLFRPAPVYWTGRNTGVPWDGDGVWYSPNAKSQARIFYYLKTELKDKPTIKILDAAGNEVATGQGTTTAGLNLYTWNALGRRRGQVESQTYAVILKVGDKEYKTTLRLEDVNLGADPDIKFQSESRSNRSQTEGEQNGNVGEID